MAKPLTTKTKVDYSLPTTENLPAPTITWKPPPGGTK
jgi:hypothetical protein